MKKIMSMVLSAAILSAMLLGSLPEAFAAEVALFAQTFGDTSGNVYTVDGDGVKNGSSGIVFSGVTAIDAALEAGIAGKSEADVSLWLKTDSTATAGLSSPVSEGRIVVSASVCPMDNFNQRHIKLTTNEGSYGIRFDSGGTIQYSTSNYTAWTNLASGSKYSGARWYRVMMVIDATTGEYDYYLNGAKINTSSVNAGVSGPITAVDSLDLTNAPLGYGGTTYFDDIEVYTTTETIPGLINDARMTMEVKTAYSDNIVIDNNNKRITYKDNATTIGDILTALDIKEYITETPISPAIYSAADAADAQFTEVAGLTDKSLYDYFLLITAGDGVTMYRYDITPASYILADEGFEGMVGFIAPGANSNFKKGSTHSPVAKWGGIVAANVSFPKGVGGKSGNDASVKIDATGGFLRAPMDGTPAVISRALNTTTDAKAVVSFNVYLENDDVLRSMQIYFGTDSTIPVAFAAGGDLTYGAAATAMPITKKYETEKWYNITYVYDRVTNLYSLYIDGKLEMEKATTGLAAAPTATDEIRLNAGSAGNVYFDDIKIYTMSSTQTYDPTKVNITGKTPASPVFIENSKTRIYVKDAALTPGGIIDELDIYNKVNDEALITKIYTDYTLEAEVGGSTPLQDGNILVAATADGEISGSYNISIIPDGRKILFDENFNLADNVTTGNVSIKNGATPTNWAKWGFGDSVVSAVSLPKGVAGKAANDTSVNITATGGTLRYTNPAGPTAPVPLAIDGKLVFSFSILPMDTTTERIAQLFFNGPGNAWSPGGTPYINVVRFSNTGGIQTYNGNTNAYYTDMAVAKTYNAGMWYHIVLVLDQAANKYDVYINGNKEIDGLSLSGFTANTLSEVRMTHTTAVSTTTYYDDLKAYNLYGDYDPADSLAGISVKTESADKAVIDLKSKRVMLMDENLTVTELLDCLNFSGTADLYTVNGDAYSKLAAADKADGAKLVITAANGITLHYYDISVYNMVEISSDKYTITNESMTISGWAKFTTAEGFIANIEADSSVNMSVYDSAGTAALGDTDIVNPGMIFRITYDENGDGDMEDEGETVDYTIGAAVIFLEDTFNSATIDASKWAINTHALTMAGLVTPPGRDGNVIKMLAESTADIRLTKTGFNTTLTNGANIVECSMMAKDKNATRGVTVRGINDSLWANIMEFSKDGTIKVFNITVATYELDTWYNIAVAWDTPNKTLKVYINGLETAIAVPGNLSQTPISTVYLFQSQNNAEMAAETYFDDFKFYPIYSPDTLDYTGYAPVITSKVNTIAFNSLSAGSLLAKPGLNIAEVIATINIPAGLEVTVYEEDGSLVNPLNYGSTPAVNGMYLVTRSPDGYGEGGIVKNTLRYDVISKDVYYAPISLTSDGGTLTAALEAIKYTDAEEVFYIVIGVYEDNKLVGLKISPSPEQVVKDTAHIFSLDYSIAPQAGQEVKAMALKDLTDLGYIVEYTKGWF